MRSESPTAGEIEEHIGAKSGLWSDIISSVTDEISPIDREWKPSKSPFGRMCLLKHKKRTLLYLTPEKDAIRAAIVLGERAVGLALAADLPEEIKGLIREARPYAEGRGIRFPVTSVDDVTIVRKLIAIKTTARSAE